MRKFKSWTLLVCVLPWVAACTTTGAVTDGSGYRTMTPNAETRSFILEHDQVFARQVAEHNTQCRLDAGCQK